MIDRILNTADEPADEQEAVLEVTLRPRDFGNYIGQERLKQNLKLAIAAAKKEVNSLIISYCTDHRVSGKTHYGKCDCQRNGCQIPITSGAGI
jgi:Holliday junction DNA helicase RuvB